MLRLILMMCFIFSAQNVFSAEKTPKVETLFQGNDVIWGFDFLSANEIIFTERIGKFKLLNTQTGKVTILKVPVEVVATGQGGLLDIKAHPDYVKSKLIYFAYSKKVSGGMTTALARFKLNENKVTDFSDVLVTNAVGPGIIHFGSRIIWDKDKSLFLAIGERNERDKAQDLKLHNGKILKVSEDGKAEVWSYGHRNPQGLALHPTTGEIYESEFGPLGGDEVNVIHKGKNYGWPVITYGKEYSGPKIGEGTHKEGMEQPLVYWVPSISPSGMDFYKGDLFLGCLSGMQLRRVQFKNNKVVGQEELLKDRGWRIRNVRAGSDALYISTDSGLLARVKVE